MTSMQPSNQKFGFFFSAIFFILSVYQWVTHKNIAAVLFLILFLFTIFSTLISPTRLEPFNKAWFRFGEILGRIVNPLVMGVIFFIILTPLAVALRLAGRDILLIKRRNAMTYWIDRDPVGPAADSYKAQF